MAAEHISKPIRELKAEVWEAVVGRDWTHKAHNTLDFSSNLFALETLAGDDGGLWNPLLNLRRLEELNLHKNKLTEVDGIFVEEASFAGSLKVLNLSRNLLTSPVIELPQLVVLDLSHNALVSFPPLNDLPSLEVLRLSHNNISGIWEDVGKCPKLVEFDVSHNAISFYPSQLEWGIYYLQSCRKLQKLYCRANPFANWFPEHVYFLANGLPSLVALDDWDLSDASQIAAAKARLKPLADYDAVYDERQAYGDYLGTGRQTETLGDLTDVLNAVPSMDFFVSYTQQALQDPDQVVSYCSLIVHGGDMIYHSSVVDFKTILGGSADVVLESTDRPIPTTPAVQALISTFLQNVTLLVERHDNVRSMLLRALAKLSPVPNENLGPLALAALSDLMHNEELQGFAAAAITESVVPCVQGQDYATNIRCRTVLRGMANMRPCLALAQAMAPCVTDLASSLEDAPTDPVLLGVLAILIDYPANAIECAGQGIPYLIGGVLKRGDADQLEDDLFVKLLQIAGRCAQSVKKAAKYFVTEQLHINLIFQSLKEHFRTPETSRWPLQKATRVAAMVDFLTGIIKTDAKGMEDCVDNFHLTDLLLIPAKEYVANPLVLGAACRGLLAIISDDTRGPGLLEYVTEQISRLQPFFQYFGGRSYKDFCDIAERHVVQKDTLPFRPSIPELHLNSNVYVHSCFCAIGNLLHFYLSRPDIPYCVVVNEFLATKKREKALFRLMTVPSNAVKFVAIRCLTLVPIENFDSEDVLMMLNLLRSFRTFSSGDASDIVVALLGVLQRLVDDTKGTAGAVLRREHPQETFDSIYDLLYRAVKLWSKSAEVEKTKIAIAVACVEFLRGASRYSEFRSFLRSKALFQQFRSILKAEEENCKPESQAVAVERCWTGRDIGVLLRCFSGLERLNPLKRVAFRAMSQLADVLEGRSAIIDYGSKITLQALAEREKEPFDEISIRKGLRSLDESEWEDREHQQMEFVASKGPEKLISFLARLAVKDFDVRLAVERKKKLDSEYWAGRLKGTKETMESNLLENNEVDTTYIKEADRLLFYPAPASYLDEGRWVVLQALHRTDHSLDPLLGAAYLNCQAGFYGSDALWDNITLGEIRITFIIAALLRALYACLLVPVSNQVTAEVLRCCRRASILRKLLSFLESTHLFDCHVGSKFFALARTAITLQPHQPAESMDMIIAYDVLRQAIHRIIRAFQYIIKQGDSRPLSQAEQIFATELCKLMAVIARQTSYIKFSAHLAVQRWAVTTVLFRYTGEMLVYAIVQMLIYDLKVASGSARGTVIEHLLESTAQGREDMRESCLVVLSELIQRCEPLKYSVLQALNECEVFQKAPIRRSLLFEILSAADCGHYSQAVQLNLSIRHQRAERVLQLVVVHHWTAALGSRDPIQKIVTVTNFVYYQLRKPPNIRNFLADAAHTSELNAKMLTVERTQEFFSITRLIRGFPSSQVLIIGWTSQNDQAAPARRGLDVKEIYEVIICNTLSSAAPLLQCIYALSGPDINSRVEVYRDRVFRACLKQHVPLEAIITAAHVIRESSPGEHSGSRMVLHVLTEERFYEFIVDWKYWFAASPRIATPSTWQSLGEDSSDDDDEDVEERRTMKQGLDNFLGYFENNQPEPGSSWDTHLLQAARQQAMTNSFDVLSTIPHMNQRGGITEEYPKLEGLRRAYREKLRIAKQHLLKKTLRYRVRRLHGVTFGNSDEPRVVYRFAKSIETPNATAGAAEDEDDNAEDDDGFDALLDQEAEPDNLSKPSQARKVKYDDVSVLYLDDSTRERWKRYIALCLNKLEISAVLISQQLTLRGLRLVNSCCDEDTASAARNAVKAYQALEEVPSDTHSIVLSYPELVESQKLTLAIDGLARLREAQRLLPSETSLPLGDFLWKIVPLIESEINLRQTLLKALFTLDVSHTDEVNRFAALWACETNEGPIAYTASLAGYTKHHPEWWTYWCQELRHSIEAFLDGERLENP